MKQVYAILREKDISVDSTTWNVGLGFARTDHGGLALRYWDTDEEDALGYLAEGRVVFGVKATF